MSIQKVVQMEITQHRSSLGLVRFVGNLYISSYHNSVFRISKFHLHVATKCLFGYNLLNGIEYNFYVKVQESQGIDMKYHRKKGLRMEDIFISPVAY